MARAGCKLQSLLRCSWRCGVNWNFWALRKCRASAVRTSRPGAGRRLVCMPAQVAQGRKALTSYLQSLGLAPETFIVRTARQAKGTKAKEAVVVAQRRRCHEQYFCAIPF